MKIFYSAKTGGFYHTSLQDDYESSPTGWPDDAIEIDNETYKSLLTAQAGGKMIASDEHGLLVVTDPEVDHIGEAVRKKQQLMSTATAAIAPLQDAYDLDVITKDEKALLIAWKAYRVALIRIDTLTAPDIEWPVIPEN